MPNPKNGCGTTFRTAQGPKAAVEAAEVVKVLAVDGLAALGMETREMVLVGATAKVH